MQQMEVLKRFGSSAGSFASFIFRRFGLIVVLLGLGYTLGYHDAYRGPNSLGWMLGELVDNMKPDAIRDARAENAAAIRQQQRQNLPSILHE